MSNTDITGSAVVYALIDTTVGFTRGVADPSANAPAYVQRDYLPLDQIQGVELRAYKHIRSVWPVAYLTDTTQPLTVSVGATDSMGSTPFVYADPQTYDGLAGTEELYYQSHGRHHALRIEYGGDQSFEVSGLDLDLSQQGKR